MLSFIFTTDVFFPRGIETCDPCHLRHILKLHLTYNTRNHQRYREIFTNMYGTYSNTFVRLSVLVNFSFQFHSSEAHYFLLFLFREFHQTFTVNGIGITFFWGCILVDCWTRRHYDWLRELELTTSIYFLKQRIGLVQIKHFFKQPE